jgi:hypothetical protein
MEHYTKKKRIYLTSKSYLKKVRLICIFIAALGAIGCALTILGMGITFTALGIMAGIGLVSLFAIRFIWKNARSVSLKAGNIILKCMSDKNVVAPIGSIREAKTSSIIGYQLTRICYGIDGGFSKFFILTKPVNDTPEFLIKEEIAASRKGKKEANHKPDSVLTQTA